MSSDTIKSASAEISSASFNSLSYKNESVGYSIRPELVTRTSLHPTIVNGNLEKRIYYSLHNDAGDCVYISQFITTPNPDGSNIPTLIPGNTSNDVDSGPNFSPPLTPPQISDSENQNNGEGDNGGDDGNGGSGGNVPAPTPGIVTWPPTIPQKPDEEEIEEEDWTFVTTGGGYSGGNGDGSDAPDAVSNCTDFTDYAAQIANGTWSGYKPAGVYGKGKTSLVYKFYETPQSAIWADYAMANTRDEHNGRGLKVFMTLPRLKSAIGMYEGSVIYSHEGSFPNLEDATDMFKDCPSLTLFRVTNNSGASKIKIGNKMFQNCSELKDCNLGTMTRLESSDWMFDGCTNLTNLDMQIGGHITSAAGMFYGCSSLKKRIGVSASNCSYMYYGCSSMDGEYGSLSNVVDGTAMFHGNTKITHADLYLPNLTNGTHMFSGCKIRSIGNVNLQSLQYGNCMLKDSALSISDVDKVMTGLSHAPAMPAENPTGSTTVPNGLQMGMFVPAEGETNASGSSMTKEQFDEKWNEYFIETKDGADIYTLSNGWNVSITERSSLD